MPVEETRPAEQPPAIQGDTAAEMLEALARFDGPPEQFLTGLLAVQCRIGSARHGAILQFAPESIGVLAVHPKLPPGSAAPDWLEAALETAKQLGESPETAVRALHEPDTMYGQPAKDHVVLVPIRAAGLVGAAAFVIDVKDTETVAVCRDRLESIVGFLALYEMRRAVQQRSLDVERLRAALEVLPSVNEHDRFIAAAMALCNEASARWQSERVGLGFLKGRYVQLKALSHTEKFSRKMKLVQDIESAMEECLDQDTEVVFPAPPDATYVSRSTSELSRRHGPSAVVSLPLRKSGEVTAVLILEREAERPFTLGEIESLRLTCEMCTARLVSLHERDRWFGAKMAHSARKGLAASVGPKHTWKKLIAVAVLAAAVILTVAKGDYTAEATFVLEATQRQVVPVPFDGYLKTADVKPGDTVEAGQVLAELDTAELELQVAAKRAEHAMHAKQADVAMKKEQYADAQIARAQAEQIAQEIKLIEHRIGNATIVSPIAGQVVQGDWEKQIRPPLKTGDLLFEVSPVESLRAELAVPAGEISEVQIGQDGQLATTSHPDQRLAFTVERINPVAEVAGQKNVFKVRATLAERRDWMLPGLEGVAKVKLGRRRLIVLWTRRLVNWVRMKLWL